jgi:hypothetical protein
MFKPKLTTIIAALCFQTGAFAQIYVKNPGNVGIGVQQPTAKLQIFDAGNASFRVGVNSNMTNANAQILNSLAVAGNNNSTIASNGAVAWDYFNNGNSPSWSGTILRHYGTAVTGNYWGLPGANLGALVFDNVSNGVITSNGSNIHISPAGTVSASFLNNGNVGIGTASPADKLHIDGNVRLSSDKEILFADNGQIRSLDLAHRILFRRSENKLELREYGNIVFSAGAIAGTETASMIVNNQGNVGIGTSSPGYKLHVAGDIKANTFYSATDTYADYVFDSTYQLPSLQEVKTFIKQNHHLPEVPSESEVKKDGINLGSHQVILLKKIEELTLYAIEHNEKLKLLEEKLNVVLKENDKLKEEVKGLKTKSESITQ